MREKQEQGCRQEMGQDGEQKPGGGKTPGDGNAEVEDGWGLGSGFTSGVKASS